jgi:AcrR family transcriptional regulator
MSRNAGTRARILDEARRLLEERPGASPSMSEVAAAAGVSRQALYLHFADRTALLLEVGRQADSAARTAGRQQRIDGAATAHEALRATISVQAELKPELQGIATALDVLRRSDTAAEAAWQEREQARLQRCRTVVKRLRAERALAPDLDLNTASQLLWAMTSQRVWDDLVADQGWTTTRYRTHLIRLAERALLASDPPS